MKFHFLLVLLIPLSLRGQSLPPASPNQPSYSLLYFGGLAPVSEHASGLAFEAELRRSRRFSWILTLGQDWEKGKAAWGTVPVSYPGLNPDDPPYTALVDFDDIAQSYARFYLGAGPQYNRRIGNGDLSGSAVFNLGYGELSQRVTYQTQHVFQAYDPGPGEPEEILYKQLINVVVKYHGLVQPGLRLQLRYTWWFTPEFAVRAGGFVQGFGVLAINKYEKSTPARHRDVTVLTDQSTRFFDRSFGFPDRAYYQSRSPEAVQLRTGLTVGLVYKPLKDL